MRASLCAAALCGALLVPAAPAPIGAQGEDTAPEPLSAEAIGTRLKDIQAEIERSGRGPVGSLPGLREIESLLRQQLAIVSSESPDPPSAGPETETTSVFALAELYLVKAGAEDALDRASRALEESREALAAAKADLERRERRRREARAALEEAPDPSLRTEAAGTLRDREIKSRVAAETVRLRTLEARAAEQALRAAESVVGDVGARIDSLREALAAGAGDPSAGRAALARREGDLRRRREALERDLTPVDLRLAAAQRRFSEQGSPPERLLREVELLALRRDALQQQMATIDAALEQLEERRELLSRWREALSGRPPRAVLDPWRSAATSRVEALARTGIQKQDRIEDLRRQRDGVDERLGRLESSDRARPLLEEQRAVLGDLLATQVAAARRLEAERRLTEQVLVDLEAAGGRVDPLELLASAWDAVHDFWGYEIAVVEDSPITVGSLVLALVFFAVGFWVSQRVSRGVGRAATKRLRLDAGASFALQTLSFYLLLVAFALMALRTVHFPLTAFTVLGGALAIGIGFGSQNIMNNFISGLILMLERPVRAQDLIEVEGNHGTVQKIGARSTQIRSVDGRYIVVPNSFFLENNLVNWTLSDDLVRAKVSVGVVYGSPTRLVEELIGRVVGEDDNVLREPAPIIVFEEFGDNSLNFDVYFWVRARSPMAVRRVQSAVRFRIDDLFREHDVVIAFPQRDVHLDSASPVDVRIVKDD